MSETPRVWIGCLGCYNAGHLIGEWFDAADAPTEMTGEGDESWNGRINEREVQVTPDHYRDAHEELWVMDHEGFAGLLTGECSPIEARELTEVLDSVDEPEAFAIYVSDHLGHEYAAEDWDAARSNFADAWCGWWDSEAEYAQELAEEVSMIEDANRWPVTCIDWGRAWDELRAGGDYWSQYVEVRGYAIFRSN